MARLRCHIEHPFVGQCELDAGHIDMHRVVKNIHANSRRWLTQVEWFGPEEII